MLETTSAFIEPVKTTAAATDPKITRRIFVNVIDVSAFSRTYSRRPG